MTLHAARVWNFLWSFSAAWKKGCFRIRGPCCARDIEEERRLCYVGMTRAMDQLMLTRAVYRRRYGTICRKPAFHRAFWRKFRPAYWRIWGEDARPGMNRGTGTLAIQEGRPPRTNRIPIILTKTKTSRLAGALGKSFPANQGGKARAPARPSTPSRTSPNSSPAAARSSPSLRSGRRAHRQARISPRTKSPTPEIWRGHGLPARGRRRRSQDYGTIPSLRLEEAGGEVCPARTGLAYLGTAASAVSPEQDSPVLQVSPITRLDY